MAPAILISMLDILGLNVWSGIMSDFRSLSCSKCGSNSVEKISEQKATSGFFTSAQEAAKFKIVVYRCVCGAAFTESEEAKKGTDKPS
jgi:hypothetical protein